jgi:cellulose biosynthesis protein BcsQ
LRGIKTIGDGMKSIAFFNNKGGVGKTTLACNVASDLALRRGLKVLMVDCDPQCNSTQLVLDGDGWASIYLGSGATHQRTVSDILKPIELGDAGVAIDVAPAPAADNRFGIDILPGHPRMSIIEDLLSRAWGETLGGDIGGIRRTNWVSSALKAYANDYDVVIFDVGPSLGSLNRTVLIGSDYFVTPMGADIFSVFGVRNIAEWITSWTRVYGAGLGLCQDRTPDALATFDLSDAAESARFVGYTVQQYITKSKQGVRRPTQAFETILQGIPEEVQESLGGMTAPHLGADQIRLGDVPNMYSLIPLAQSVNSPIASLQASDGLAGGQYRQQENYVSTIKRVTDALASNTGVLP